VSITVFEKATSRSSTLDFQGSSEITIEFFVIDSSSAASETAVLAAVVTQLGAYYTGFALLILLNVKVSPKGGPYWEGSITYGVPNGDVNKDSPGDESGDTPEPTDLNFLNSSFAFEVSSGSLHLTQSTNTITQSAAPGIVIPKTSGAIGIDRNRIAGVDIVDGKFEFTYTVIFNNLTWGYLKNLRYLVGSVNSKVLFGFQPGELLLIGASGSYRTGTTSNYGIGSWEVAFKYWAQYNQTGIVVGSIAPFNKNGWDYVWFGYSEQVDPNGSGLTIQVPVYASVERVYPYLNHGRLGFSDKNIINQN
jgi:hypothetical protein